MSPGLRALLGRLQTWLVEWRFTFVPSDNPGYELGTDIAEADLSKANVVSSLVKPAWSGQGDQHILLLDCDYPVHTVETSTPGHHHVYFDLPNRLNQAAWEEIMTVLGKYGVIEPGYAEISVKRGRADARLPWVHKQDQKLAAENPKGESIDDLSVSVVAQQHNNRLAGGVPGPPPF